MANITTRNLTSTSVTSSNLNKGQSLTSNEMDSNFINLNEDKLEKTDGNITGSVTVNGATSGAVGSLVFKEASGNGTSSITIKPPTDLTSGGGTITFTLPATDGNANEVLITDGSGNLSFSASQAGDITQVTAGTGLSGGGASGDVTLNIDTATTVDLSTSQSLSNKTLASPLFSGSVGSNITMADTKSILTANGSNGIIFNNTGMQFSGFELTGSVTGSSSHDFGTNAAPLGDGFFTTLDTTGTITAGSNIDLTGTLNTGNNGQVTSTQNLTVTTNGFVFFDLNETNASNTQKVNIGNLSDFTSIDANSVTTSQLNVNQNIVFEGGTANAFETTLTVTEPTQDNTLTLPDVTDTLVARDTAETLTNKTINADNNSISNIEVDNLKSGVLDTDISSVSGSDDTLASAKAIKTYVDATVAATNEVVEDTTPQLGGNLDLNSNNITGTGNLDYTGSLTLSGDISGDSGDMNIANTVDGSNLLLKVDDTGGTTRTGLTVAVDDFTNDNAAGGGDSDGSTDYAPYILQEGLGIKIGPASQEFSSTGGAPNNNTANYRLNGVLISPTGNTWPTVNLVSTGQSAGMNPLKDNIGSAGGFADEFPNAAFLFNAANGTAASPSALSSGKRVGQIGFQVHDGTAFGGSGAASSASITVTSAETASSSNARGVNMIFDFLPIGGSASDGDASSDRKTALTLDHDTFQVGTSSNDVPSQFYGNVTFEDTVNVTGTLNADGDFTVDGNTTLGNGSSDNITPNGRFADHLITNNISNLGESSNRWGFLYAEDVNVSIDTTLGRDLDVGRDATITGGLQVDGTDVDFTNLPTSDPGVNGRLYRSGNDVKISTG